MRGKGILKSRLVTVNKQAAEGDKGMIETTTPCGDGMVLDIRVLEEVGGIGKPCIELFRVKVVPYSEGRFRVSVGAVVSDKEMAEEAECGFISFLNLGPREIQLLRILSGYRLPVHDLRQIVTEIGEFLDQHLGPLPGARNQLPENQLMYLRC